MSDSIEPIKKFEEYMTRLTLTPATAQFWKERFYAFDGKSQKELLVLFDDFPNDIEFFTDLQIKKEWALKDQDKKTFDQLVLQEAEFIAQAYTNK